MPTHEEIVRLHAETYHSLAKSEFRSREKYVVHLKRMHAYFAAAWLAQGRTVLDLGCNIGEGSAILSGTAEKVVGVDVSGTVIAAAKRRYSELPIEFLLVDGVRLPFADDSFDLVASFQVIEHIVDQNIFIGELRRVLRPGGIALITTPNAEMRLDPGMAPWNRFHVREFTPSELATHLRTFFSSVKVLGLFAEEPLYSIEVGRTQRIRAHLRRQLATGESQRRREVPPPRGAANRLRSLARRIAGPAVSRLVHKLMGKPPPVSGDIQDFLDRYGQEHLAYLAERADLSMDLAAICTDDRDALDWAAGQLLSAGAGNTLSYRPPIGRLTQPSNTPSVYPVPGH